MAPLSKWIVLAAASVLLGCGGSGSVENAARLRFFDGFTGTGDVRVLVGDHLYESDGDAAISTGDRAVYDKVPSGLSTITVRPYAGTGAAFATLASRNLVEGLRYTLVGRTATGTTTSTRSLLLLEDDPQIESTTAAVRVVDVSSAYPEVYVIMRRGEETEPALYSFLETGDVAGYDPVFLTDENTETFTLNVYRTSALTNSVSDTVSVTLKPGSATTVFLYDTSTGSSRVRVRVATDVEGNDD